jgi:deoxyribodipyrimidine photolyase-related protein
MSSKRKDPVRNLVVVFGDQLTEAAPAFKGFQKTDDLVWMAEAEHEAEHVWSHKARIVMFLSSMRHFRDRLRSMNYRVEYTAMGYGKRSKDLGSLLEESIRRLSPQRVVATEPGEWRIEQLLLQAASKTGAKLEIRADDSFFCSRQDFSQYAGSRKRLLMEFFYRKLRNQFGVLIEDGEPSGGKWNFDKQNRRPFAKDGPRNLPRPPAFQPDRVTAGVIRTVNRSFPDHPGTTAHFDWPVTAEEAATALKDFLAYRLDFFGPHQDAMWEDEPFLYHSLLSPAMNLKLLKPRFVVKEAETAYGDGRAALSSVEGFIRQILGWREYIRGVYWHYMPRYAEMNCLGADLDLPRLYWTAETDMNCMHQSITQTLQQGYAHHIQRLMVTGLYALLCGIKPVEVHKWYLAVYVDAVEWAELPNTIGMSQFADGGILGTKPYVATGQYINRMSNYCKNCRFVPSRRLGETACPFTTLYWDFLLRNEQNLRSNPRMKLQFKNVARLSKDEERSLRRKARNIKQHHA